jgi:acetoin utilization protein AcuB
MIVQDIMATKLLTVEPDDTLAHAATLLRQRQFHHLPVTRSVREQVNGQWKTVSLFVGVLTAQDITMAVALANQGASPASQPWQERRVIESMHRAPIRVTPTTSVAAAAQILVERGLNYLPVVEYSQQLLTNGLNGVSNESAVAHPNDQPERENKAILVGLVTRSDLLIAFVRAMGTFEPGMSLDIDLPMGNVVPLARTLQLAAELRVPIRSVMAAPLVGGVPTAATLRLGTINPGPLLLRLQEEDIQYSFGSSLAEVGDSHA